MTPEDIEAYVTAAAAALQLPIAPEHRPGVLHYFAMAADLAELLEGFELALHDEPAAVFTPVAPAQSGGEKS